MERAAEREGTRSALGSCRAVTGKGPWQRRRAHRRHSHRLRSSTTRRRSVFSRSHEDGCSPTKGAVDIGLGIVADHHRFVRRRPQIGEDGIEERRCRLAEYGRFDLRRIFERGDEGSSVEARSVRILEVSVRRNGEKRRTAKQQPERRIEPVSVKRSAASPTTTAFG